MNDAGEVLLTVYERIRALALAQGLDPVVDRVFGLAVTEAVNCHRCGQTTHQNQYTQYFYNTQVRYGTVRCRYTAIPHVDI